MEPAPSPWRFVERHPRLILLVLSLGLLSAGSWLLPLQDRDEPRFSSATREMMERGDWVIPYFNGNYRFDKPVGIYWLMRGSYALLGVHEYSARLPSILCSAGIVLLLFEWARRWWGVRAGFLAGLGLATSFQFLANGRLATADMALILALVAAQYGQWRLLNLDGADGPGAGRRRWFWLLYGSMGWAFLVKGPLGLGMPLLTLLFFRWVFWRKPLPWARLSLGRGYAVALAILLPWGVLALLRTDPPFIYWGKGMVEHVGDRGLVPWGGRGYYGPLYYLVTGTVSLLPWLPFAPTLWRWLRRGWDMRRAYATAWFTGVFALFSLYATQLPHYTLPAFPGIFLALGGALAAATSGEPGLISRRWAAGALAFQATLATGLLLLAWGPAYPDAFLPLSHALIGAALILIGLLLVGISVLANRPRWMFPGAALAAAALVWSAAELRSVHPVVQIRDAIRQAPAGQRLLAYRFEEGTLTFYAEKNWRLSTVQARANAREDFLQRFRQPGPVLAVVGLEEVKLGAWFRWAWARRQGIESPWPGRPLDDVLGSLDLSGCTVREVQGFNPGNTQWVRVALVERPQ